MARRASQSAEVYFGLSSGSIGPTPRVRANGHRHRHASKYLFTPLGAKNAADLARPRRRLVSALLGKPPYSTSFFYTFQEERMARESSPIWVWMTFAILVMGSLAYWGLVMFAEYLFTELG